MKKHLMGCHSENDSSDPFYSDYDDNEERELLLDIANKQKDAK